MNTIPRDPMPGVLAARAFILELGRALHEGGAPAHRIEDAMSVLARRLQVEGQFFTAPTSIFASFGPPEEQRTAMMRVEPAVVNLERLSRLDELILEVEEDRIGPADAIVRLRSLRAGPERYGPVLSIACFGLAAAAVARLLGGGGREILAGAAIGLQTGLLAQVASRKPAAARVFEWLAALAASLAALLWASLAGPLAPTVSALAGLIVLIPGFSLTVALTELATRNLVSGTARLAGAGMAFLAIGFGLALGARLAPAVGPAALGAPAAPLPGWTEAVAVALAPFALTVLFRARPRDAGVILAGGGVAFGVARAVTQAGGGELGMLAAAFAIGLVGNLYARAARQPAAVPIVPAIVMLVPGGLGVRGVATVVARDVITGMEMAFTLVVMATALAAGLLLANLVAPPRRAPAPDR